MSIRDRLVKGTAWNMIAVTFNQGSTLLVNIAIARILMKHAFGEYAMVQSTLLTMAALSQLATGYTASKYIAEYRFADPEKAGRIMGLCALVSVLTAAIWTICLIAMAPFLADTMLKASHLVLPLIIGSGYLLFSSINGYQIGVLSALEAYRSLAKAGVISGIAAVTAISLGAWLGGLNGSLIGLSISALARCAIHNKWLRDETRLQGIMPRYCSSLRQEKAVIFNFALPAAVSGYYSMPLIWLANSFLVRQPDGYSEMALFAAANNLRILVLFLPNVMNSVGLSILNNEKSNGDVSHFNRVFRCNLLYIFLASVGGACTIGALGKPILHLFGKDFGTGYLLLLILLTSSVFEATSIALYQFLQSRSKIWYSFFGICVPREAFLVIASYWLVQLYGGLGLAFAYLGSTLIGLILHLYLVASVYAKERRPQSSVLSFSKN